MANRSLAAKKAAATKARNRKEAHELREAADAAFNSMPEEVQEKLIEGVRNIAASYEYTINTAVEEGEREALDALHDLVEEYGSGLVRLAAEVTNVWHEPVANDVSDLVRWSSGLTTDFGTVNEDMKDAILHAEYLGTEEQTATMPQQ
jgi:hypothetical protein